MCVINVPALHEKCYNLKNDYDDNGNLKTGSKPLIRQYGSEHDMLLGLNKHIGTDPTGWANIKAFIRELVEKSKRSGG